MSLADRDSPILPNGGRRMSNGKVKFYYKPGCRTCKKAKEALERRGFELQLIDMIEDPPPRSLLETHIDAKDVKSYLNTHCQTYRTHDLRNDPPTKKGAIELMMRDPELIKRPVIVKDKMVLFGFDPEKIAEL